MRAEQGSTLALGYTRAHDLVERNLKISWQPTCQTHVQALLCLQLQSNSNNSVQSTLLWKEEHGLPSVVLKTFHKFWTLWQTTRMCMTRNNWDR